MSNAGLRSEGDDGDMYSRFRARAQKARFSDAPVTCLVLGILNLVLVVMWLGMAITFGQPLNYLTAAVWAVASFVWFRRAIRARTRVWIPVSGWYHDPWGTATDRFYDTEHGWTGWIA
jgi:hypothetical protein